MGIIFTSPLPCGPPQFHIAVAPCLAIVEVIYKASPSATQVVGGDILTDIISKPSSIGRIYWHQATNAVK